MHFLRQGTAVDVLIGPFTDLTDGTTSEAGESPTVELSKNGQALAAKSDVTVPVYDSLGYYNCELDATDTDTTGTLRLVVEATATAGPVFHDFTVIEQLVYDTIYSSSPTILTAADIGQIYDSTIGTVNSQTSFDMDTTIISDDDWIGLTVTIQDAGTDELAVRWITDVDQANDRIIINAAPPFTVVATDVLRVESREHPSYSLANYDPPTRGEATSDRNIITDDLLAYAQLIARSDSGIATDRSTELAAINADEGSGAGDYDNVTSSNEALSEGVIFGLAQTGTLSTTTMTTDLTGYADDELIGATVVWTGGTAAGQRAEITDYASASGQVSYSAGITTAPVNGDNFKIV